MAKKKLPEEIIENKGKFKCTKCGLSKKTVEYYSSDSTLYKDVGHMPICKDCVFEIYKIYYDKSLNNERATYLLCRRLDFPFSSNAFKGAEIQSEKTGWTICQSYFKQVNSFRVMNNYGTCFDESSDFLETEIQENYDFENMETDEELAFKLTPELMRKWNSRSAKEILFLENEFQDWCSRYDVSTKAMEVNIKNICYQQLAISRKQALSIPVDKELKTLSELMNDSALKPIQEAAAMSSEYNTLGTWIKKFENEDPCPEADEELQDVDGLLKYIRVWFLGHMCKILGIENEYSNEYDEEMLKYTINFGEEETPQKDKEDEEVGLDA